MIRLARDAGMPVITGAEVIALQAAEQFVLYTGVRPDARTGRARIGVLAGRAIATLKSWNRTPKATAASASSEPAPVAA